MSANPSETRTRLVTQTPVPRAAKLETHATMTETEFRLSEVSRRLVNRYRRRAPKRDAHLEDPLEELIHTILSQQNIGIVTQRLYDALKKAFPTWKQALEVGSDGIQRVLEGAGGGLAAVKAKKHSPMPAPNPRVAR
ncbi:MAG: hypothetical protein HC933_07805 [Pleurocapsa sp. SU_196_0]|nr:hypothetical protein [Pleurocapsa sp. SU_196_0]